MQQRELVVSSPPHARPIGEGHCDLPSQFSLPIVSVDCAMHLRAVSTALVFLCRARVGWHTECRGSWRAGRVYSRVLSGARTRAVSLAVREWSDL